MKKAKTKKPKDHPIIRNLKAKMDAQPGGKKGKK